jgi:predicted transcriptional regulator
VPGLSTSAKKVYFYLSHVSDKDGYAFPFVRTIAARTHLSKATVGHALNELEQAGLLTRVHRYSRRGGSSNIYRLRPPG